MSRTAGRSASAADRTRMPGVVTAKLRGEVVCRTEPGLPTRVRGPTDIPMGDPPERPTGENPVVRLPRRRHSGKVPFIFVSAYPAATPGKSSPPLCQPARASGGGDGGPPPPPDVPVLGPSFPGSAWERTAWQAPPARLKQRGRASPAVRSQAEPGNEGARPDRFRRSGRRFDGVVVWV